MAFCAHAFCIRHELFNTFVAVILLEITEVRKCSCVWSIDLFHDASKPFAVTGKATMIFNNDVEFELGRVFRETREAINSEFLLLFIGPFAGGIDPNGVTSETFGCLNPWKMVLNSSGSCFFTWVAKFAKAITHNEYIGDAFISCPLVKLSEIVVIFCLVFKKLIDVFDGINAIRSFGFSREV